MLKTEKEKVEKVKNKVKELIKLGNNGEYNELEIAYLIIAMATEIEADEVTDEKILEVIRYNDTLRGDIFQEDVKDNIYNIINE